MRGVYDAKLGKMSFFFFVVDELIHEYVPEVRLLNTEFIIFGIKFIILAE